VCNFIIDWPPILLVGAGNWVQPKKTVGACLTLARVFRSPFAPSTVLILEENPSAATQFVEGARVHARGEKILGLESN
jgi:hypothetical protein